MEYSEKLEEIAMLIIANSGAARSSSFEALKEAKNGNFDEAEKLMEKVKEYADSAHKNHSELLKMDAKGEVDSIGVLISHAQDHLMSSVLAGELIDEIIYLHKTIRKED